MRWYDAETGEQVTAPKKDDNTHGIPFDPNVAETFARSLASGIPFKKCLENAGLTSTQYIRWRQKNQDFSALIDAARELRSENMHDFSFDSDIAPIISKDTSKMDDAQRKRHHQDINMASSRQKLIRDFLRRDAPRRFGVRLTQHESRSDLTLSLKAEIPKEIQALVNKSFRPKLTAEGELEVAGIQKNDENEIISQQ